MSDMTLNLSRHLLASPEAVFDAWITPSSMGQWLSPMTTCDVPRLDLRVGGEYQIDMHGEGAVHVHTGKYLEIDRPNKLVFTWHSEGTGQQETVVTLEMKAAGEGTDFTLTHERFPSAESRDNHEKGWTAILAKLEGELSGAKA